MTGPDLAELYGRLDTTVQGLYRLARDAAGVLDGVQTRRLLDAALLVDAVTSEVDRRIAEGEL